MVLTPRLQAAPRSSSRQNVMPIAETVARINLPTGRMLSFDRNKCLYSLKLLILFLAPPEVKAKFRDGLTSKSRLGSVNERTKIETEIHVHLTSENGLRANNGDVRFAPFTGLMHCSKQGRKSATSSASAKLMSRWIPDAIEQWSLTDQSRSQPVRRHQRVARPAIPSQHHPVRRASHGGNPG